MAFLQDEIVITITPVGENKFKFHVSGTVPSTWGLFYDILDQNSKRMGSTENILGLSVFCDNEYEMRFSKLDQYRSQKVHENPVVYVLDNMMASLGFSVRRVVEPHTGLSAPMPSVLTEHLGMVQTEPVTRDTKVFFERVSFGSEPPPKKRKTLAYDRNEPVSYIIGKIIDDVRKKNIQIIGDDGSITIIARDKIETITGHREGLVDFYLLSGRVIQVRTNIPGESVVDEIHRLGQITTTSFVSIVDPVDVTGEITPV